MSARFARLRAWLELVRPPNLPTVPGDPLAGFALASARRGAVSWDIAWAPATAALLLYAAGLIWNDCADLAKDRAHRPRRPLPGGCVAPRRAALAGALLALCGMAIALAAGPATGLWGTVLLVLVLAYDFAPRGVLPGVRALLMGACRGASLLMGASAAAPVHAWSVPVGIAAAGLVLYIAAVTCIAARETEAVRIGPARWIPVLVFALTYAGLLHPMARVTGHAWLGIVLSLGAAAYPGVRLGGVPLPARTGRAIGGWIRALLPLQAALCFIAGAPPLAGVLLLSAWPLSAVLARRFYAS